MFYLLLYRVLLAVEDYLQNVAINPEANVTQNEQNIAVFSRDVNPSTFQGAKVESLNDTERLDGLTNDFAVSYDNFTVQPRARHSQISLAIPNTLFQNLDIDSQTQNQRISFVVYRKPTLFQSKVEETTNEETINKLNSWVVSGSVKGEKISNSTDPIVTTYQPLEKGIYKRTACVFWEFSLSNGVGDWSQTGCTFKGFRYGIVTCHCSHLTNFAILMVRIHVCTTRVKESCMVIIKNRDNSLDLLNTYGIEKKNRVTNQSNNLKFKSITVELSVREPKLNQYYSIHCILYILCLCTDENLENLDEN